MSRIFRALADPLNEGFASADLAKRLRLIRAATDGRVVFTTSFGIEDQAITHAIGAQKLDIEFATLDTGRLFPETYDVWARTEERYGLRVKAVPSSARKSLQELVAHQGINGFYNSLAERKACCECERVEPLRARSTAPPSGSPAFAATNPPIARIARFVEFDEARGLLKASPLLDFARDEVAAFCATNDVPTNVLHERGFVSIGCAPCTRAIKPGEPERAGRWWWEDEAKKECGLHVGADGKFVRTRELAASCPAHPSAKARSREHSHLPRGRGGM